MIDTAVCAIDRDQGGLDNVAAEGVTLRSALRRADLVEAAAEATADRH